MTKQKHIEKLMNKVVEALPPQKYVKIEDLGIDLLIPRTGLKINNFDRAIDELIAIGRVELCGNAIRLNQ